MIEGIVFPLTPEVKDSTRQVFIEIIEGYTCELPSMPWHLISDLDLYKLAIALENP